MPQPPRTILDVCCSYGINAALLRSGMTFAEMAAHYGDAVVAGLTSAQLAERDRQLVDRRDRPGYRIVGLDASVPAVGYAVSAGLLDAAWTDDLEHHDPSPGLAAALREVDVVLCTGGVGYVGAPTFSRVLAGVADPGRIRVVSFVLRSIDYGPVADALAEHGLVTETLPDGPVRQRRFTDEREQEASIRAVRARGLDPTGLETEGWHYATGFLSRPARR
jgi:SAM-dependent methyltransferase